MYLTAKRFLSPTNLALIIIICFIICMVIFPSSVFKASKAGISAWWNIVFPALLPFFISSELLMGYGVVQFMGVLLEPLMRPLFRLPGTASFVMMVGYTSGFPISASLAARLRKEKLCTRFEAERLMTFTNNASPLFMLVAVGVGMFNSPRLGVLIAICHYTGNIILGFLLRFYKNRSETRLKSSPPGNLLKKAFIELKKAQRVNTEPLGKKLSNAITSSINKLLVIGGFVVVFSIIIEIFITTGLMNLVYKTLNTAASPMGLSPAIIQSLSRGVFEITLGIKSASEAQAPLVQKLIVSSVILGWSGIAVLAQVAAMIADTDLKMNLFIFGRLIHSLFAGFLCYLLLQTAAVKTWLANPASTDFAISTQEITWLSTLSYSGSICLYLIVTWLILGFLTGICYSLRLFMAKK